MNRLPAETMLLLCWAGLILATLATVYWGAYQATTALQLAAIVPVALFKSVLIIDGFMELRHAAWRWRLLMYGWPVVMVLVVAVTLLFAPAG